MARKKKHSEEETDSGFTNEIIGLVLILFSVVGLGNFGLVGGLVKKFAVFMFGSWFWLFLILTLIFGALLIIKRGKPVLFNSRLIGGYLVIIAILLFLHIRFITSVNLPKGEIISQTITNIQNSFNVASELKNTGGGIVGALLSFVFIIYLFLLL